MATIKKIILSALTTLIMVGCGLSVESNTRVCNEYYQVIVLDSCEYYSHTTRCDLTHKGNCRFCKERRQKELKELIKELKEK